MVNPTALLTPAPRFSDPAIFKSLLDAHTTRLRAWGDAGTDSPEKVGDRNGKVEGFDMASPSNYLDMTI